MPLEPSRIVIWWDMYPEVPHGFHHPVIHMLFFFECRSSPIIEVPKFALFFVLCWILRTDWERRPDRGRAAEPRSRWFRRTMASVSTRFFESLAPRRTEWSLLAPRGPYSLRELQDVICQCFPAVPKLRRVATSGLQVLLLYSYHTRMVS